jgi:hypothetical protein
MSTQQLLRCVACYRMLSLLQERPRPSLHARCYLRLGMLQWHHQNGGGLAGDPQLSSCMELMRVSVAASAILWGFRVLGFSLGL